MAPSGIERGGLAIDVDGFLWLQESGHGLEGYPEEDVLSVGDAALYATAVIAPCLERGWGVRSGE